MKAVKEMLTVFRSVQLYEGNGSPIVITVKEMLTVFRSVQLNEGNGSPIVITVKEVLTVFRSVQLNEGNGSPHVITVLTPELLDWEKRGRAYMVTSILKNECPSLHSSSCSSFSLLSSWSSSLLLWLFIFLSS